MGRNDTEDINVMKTNLIFIFNDIPLLFKQKEEW